MFAKVIIPSTLLLAAASVNGLNYARDGDWFEARDVMQRDLFSAGAYARRAALEQRDSE